MGGKSGGGVAQQQQPPASYMTPQGTNAPQGTGAPTGGKGSGKGGGGVPQRQDFSQPRPWMSAPTGTPNQMPMGGIAGLAPHLAQANAPVKPAAPLFGDGSYGGAYTGEPAAPAATGIAAIPGMESMANAWNKMQQMRALQGVSGQRGLGLGREGGIGKGAKGGGGNPQQQFMQESPNGVAPPLPTLVSRGDFVPMSANQAITNTNIRAPIEADTRQPPPAPVAAAPAPVAAPAARPAAAPLSDVARHQQRLADLRARGGLQGRNG